MAAGAVARRRPTCSAIIVPWLKPTSASADGGSLWRASSASRKRCKRRCGLVDAEPALVRIPHRERKPLPADRRLPARLRCVRRNESGVRQHLLARRGRYRSGRCRRRRSRGGKPQAVARFPTAEKAADHRAHRPFRPRFALYRFCRLHGRAFAAFDRTIIGPQHARGHRAPGPPGFGERRHFFCRRPRAQAEGQPRRFLQGKIARRPGVGVAEAGQQINVGGPWPDAMDGGERRMGFVGRQVGKRRRAATSCAMARAISFSARIFGDDRPSLGQPWRSRAHDGGRLERIEAAASRPQIAPALAVESCCDTIVVARPAKPSGRRRNGGRPAVAISAENRGSAAISAAMPLSRSLSVRMWESLAIGAIELSDGKAPVKRHSRIA